MRNYLQDLYHSIRNSIGFYPALIALTMSALVMILLSLETPELTEKIKDNASMLIIDNAETARSLLSTLIGGVISLTVFSFSMVMILLNQASSNYSPRLLPGLISNKQHQFVLGFYIGTILFNMICLINILPGENPFQIPGFTVLIGILLGPVCLILFVFFIHSISQAIQINIILERLYRETIWSLSRLKDKMEENIPSTDPIIDDANWFPIESTRYGHLMNVSESELVELARKHDMALVLSHPRGMAVMEGETMLMSSKKLDREVAQEMLEHLHFGNQEIIKENFLFGFKQLVEILLKAMSPGINDPGTAMEVMDYLSELIAKRMEIGNYLSILDEEKVPRLHVKIVDFEELIYYCFAAIRTYIVQDPVVLQKMFSLITHLETIGDGQAQYLEVLKKEKQALWKDTRKNIKNKHDLNRIRLYVEEEE